jgi:hypothetical protein
MLNKILMALCLSIATPVFAMEAERISSIKLEGILDVARHNHETESNRMLTAIESEWMINTGVVSYVLGGRLRTDQLDDFGLSSSANNNYFSSISEPYEVSDRSEFEIRNFYLRYLSDHCPFSTDSCQLRFGKQQIVWGQADGIKVLDVVNPQSFEYFILDDFNDSRIPLWSVNYEVGAQDNEFQFIWILDTTSHFIPDLNKAYGIRSPWLSLVPGVVQPTENVVIENYNAPPVTIKNSDYGFRFRTFINGWDFSLNYLYKYNDFPILASEPVEINGEDGLLLKYKVNRNYLVGGTFSNAFGELTLRGEIAYTTDRMHVSTESSSGVSVSDELDYIIGLDWYGFSDALFSLQYYNSTLIDSDYRANRGEQNEIATFLYKQFFIQNTLEAKVSVANNLDFGDGVNRYTINYNLTDESVLKVEYNQFYGARDGLFGQYANNDHLRISWKYTF